MALIDAPELSGFTQLIRFSEICVLCRSNRLQQFFLQFAKVNVRSHFCADFQEFMKLSPVQTVPYGHR